MFPQHPYFSDVFLVPFSVFILHHHHSAIIVPFLLPLSFPFLLFCMLCVVLSPLVPFALPLPRGQIGIEETTDAYMFTFMFPTAGHHPFYSFSVNTHIHKHTHTNPFCVLIVIVYIPQSIFFLYIHI